MVLNYGLAEAARGREDAKTVSRTRGERAEAEEEGESRSSEPFIGPASFQSFPTGRVKCVCTHVGDESFFPDFIIFFSGAWVF